MNDFTNKISDAAESGETAGSVQLYKLELSIEPDDETEITLAYRFKRPGTASYDRYIKTVSSSMVKASKIFLLDNVVPEDKDRLSDDIEMYPALPISAADKLMAMLGFARTSNLTKV